MVETSTERSAVPAARVLRTCTCCGSTRLSRIGEYRCEDPFFAARVHPDLDVLRCDSCGLAQVDHAHLDGDEFASWQERAAARPQRSRSRRSFAWLGARGRAIAELSRRLQVGPRVERIFQLGAGAGMDLVALQRVHRSAECWADRLDHDAAWRSLARVGTLLDGPYERILMTHVLGHVHDPVSFVRRVIASLRHDGLLIVEVGNDLAPALERRTTFEPQLTFFTIRTLRKLFATNFSQDLSEVHAATAGPRIGDLEEVKPPDGFWARVLGRGSRTEVDLSDDPEAEDRAFARIVLRRRVSGAAEPKAD